MERDVFSKRLSEILRESAPQFAGDGRLPEDLDSVVILDIMALVDELSGVAISPEALKKARNADDILRLVEAEAGK